MTQAETDLVPPCVDLRKVEVVDEHEHGLARRRTVGAEMESF